MYSYIYNDMCVYRCVYIYIYIYVDRERERARYTFIYILRPRPCRAACTCRRHDGSQGADDHLRHVGRIDMFGSPRAPHRSAAVRLVSVLINSGYRFQILRLFKDRIIYADNSDDNDNNEIGSFWLLGLTRTVQAWNCNILTIPTIIITTYYYYYYSYYYSYYYY